MKFPVADLGMVEALLRQVARSGPTLDEADHYFNAPDRDFARTDEALRLRRIGPGNLVTYKGPKQDAQTKTRTEIEVPLADGDRVADAFARLLTCLGYRSVLVVRKRRQLYYLDREGVGVEVCLDDVAQLGQFVELEIVTAAEKLDQSRAVLMQLAEELGLTGSERRSYLEMLLEKKGSR
jgi:adenylate cyclase class 2